MELNYCINSEAETPIMFIDKHIGFDDVDGWGIRGDLFMKELMYLDSLEKKEIKILINSIGGSVMDGMVIYHAIRAAKTHVTTQCIGLAASISAVIFQAGDTRIMNDFGILMLHNPSGGTTKSLKNFKEAIMAMISRCGVDENTISNYMNNETWINGTEKEFKGIFWDETNQTEKVNLKELTAVLNSANNILIKEKQNNMNIKIKNSLGLTNEATHEEVLEAIENLKDSVKNSTSLEIDVEVEAEKPKQYDTLKTGERISYTHLVIGEAVVIEGENEAEIKLTEGVYELKEERSTQIRSKSITIDANGFISNILENITYETVTNKLEDVVNTIEIDVVNTVEIDAIVKVEDETETETVEELKDLEAVEAIVNVAEVTNKVEAISDIKGIDVKNVIKNTTSRNSMEDLMYKIRIKNK